MLPDRALQLRLWWTSVIVVIALSAAGLAVAADRPHDASSRPELTWRADGATVGWLTAMSDGLTDARESIAQVASAGTDVVGGLQTLDTAVVTARLEQGDAAATVLTAQMSELATLRDAGRATIADWRLSDERAALVNAMDAAGDAALIVSPEWLLLGEPARAAAELVDALLRHDGILFRAITASERGDFDTAIQLIAEARTELEAAREARGEVGPGSDAASVDELLADNTEYGAALTALYAYVRDTGLEDGKEHGRLRTAADAAREALPSTEELTRVVGAVTGPALTTPLTRIEEARGVVNAALADAAPIVGGEQRP